jgi:Ser/Thr protein kinase RdoA (MazF antagonist)
LEKRIKVRFNDTILSETLDRYGADISAAKPLDGFESFIYEYAKDGQEYILRIGHTHRRSIELIQGEVDWINYLFDGGVHVAKANLSESGRLVESIPDEKGEHFLAVSFLKADGAPPTKNNWNEKLFNTYGQVIGKIHALSKKYVLPNQAWERPQWDDPEMLDMSGWLPANEYLVLEKYKRLKTHLNALPRGQETYGLIHQDAHGGNFFVDEEGAITLFDFDDCAYSWYMNDIAIVLFYAVIGEEDASGFTRRFMTSFLKGYSTENQLDPLWLREIPPFLKLREIDLYGVIHRSFDVDKIADPWSANYMNNRRDLIENDVPFIDFDFETLEPFMI